jgi:hypothetical protein
VGPNVSSSAYISYYQFLSLCFFALGSFCFSLFPVLINLKSRVFSKYLKLLAMGSNMDYGFSYVIRFHFVGFNNSLFNELLLIKKK